jgi:spore coat protein U-like protein
VIKHLTLVLALLLCALPANAAVTVNCTVTAGSILFGLYSPLASTANAVTGALKITCTGSGSGSKTVTAGLTLSTGSSGNYGTRTLRSGANTLNYNIYWSTAYNQIMGDGSGGSFGGTTNAFTVTAGGTSTATGTMYGLIPALQDVAPGTYSDTILVSVDY